MRFIEFLAMLLCSLLKKIPIYMAFVSVSLVVLFMQAYGQLDVSGWIRTPLTIGYGAIAVLAIWLIRPFERAGDKMMTKMTILSKAKHAVIPFNSAIPLIICVVLAFLLSFVDGNFLLSLFTFGTFSAKVPLFGKLLAITQALIFAMWLYMVLEETVTFINKDTRIMESEVE